MSAIDLSLTTRDPVPIVDLGSWELAVRTGLVSYSRGFAAALGLAERETFTLADWEALILAEDRPAFLAALDACLRTGSATSESRVARADGTVRLVLVRCDADEIGATGPQTVRGAVVDITSRATPSVGVELRHHSSSRGSMPPRSACH